MVSDQDRRELYAALEQGFGEGPAGTLMELLPPVGWADLARQSDLVAIRGEIAEVRGEIGGVRGEIAEVRGEIGGVRGEIAEVRGEIGGVRGEMAEVRGELARLNARIDGQIPKFLWGNVPVVASVAGLVLAAAKLA